MIRMTRREANPKVAELKKLPLFTGLSPTVIGLLASNLDEVKIPKGERFIKEGSSNDTFLIVLDGEADVSIGDNIHEVVGPGGIVGLPSMFTRLESTATAVARTPIRALVASHRQFNSLMASPEIEIRFKAAVFDRLRDEVYQLSRQQAKSSEAKSGKAKPVPKTKAAGKKK